MSRLTPLGSTSIITQLQQLFSTRVLSIVTAFERYGPEKAQLMQQVKQGQLAKYPGEFDVLIGCTALVHNLTPVTRKTRYFADIVGTCWSIGCRSMRTGSG